jgi:hypothetical protein
MAPVRTILDTGAGPNLIREEILPEDWERSRLSVTPAYQIIGAGGRPLRQKGVIKMHVQLGTLRVQSRFVVVTSLAPVHPWVPVHKQARPDDTPEGETCRVGERRRGVDPA